MPPSPLYIGGVRRVLRTCFPPGGGSGTAAANTGTISIPGPPRLAPLLLFCTATECRLEQRYSWTQYWNYLRRQLFVMDTYATPHNRALNLVMAAVHVWASSFASAPVLAGEKLSVP